MTLNQFTNKLLSRKYIMWYIYTLAYLLPYLELLK